MTPLEIRPIEPRDNGPLEAVIRAGLSEFDAAGPEIDGELADMAAAYGAPRSGYFVALRGGELLGGGGIGPLAGGPAQVCELRKMYLSPAARGHGVGRQLITACLDAAVAYGYTECYLETMTSMARARRLYESFGFSSSPEPRGNTGRSRCNTWYNKVLEASS